MRSFLLGAFIVFAFVVALLYVFRHAVRRQLRGSPATTAPVAPPVPHPERLPELARRAEMLRHAPELQQILAEFVRECGRRGVPAVAELSARLRDEPDVQIEPRWIYENGRLRGFPSLRSAYLAALIEIPGAEARDALLMVLATTRSADEAYLIAAGLERRGEGGFTAAVLDRAVGAGPGDAEVARSLVDLVSRADPEGTLAELVARSPRGTDATDPALLAQALEVLPPGPAFATVKGLLADPQVTRKAKERYLRSLCDRGDPETFAMLREVANEGLVDRELRVTMAYAAVGSRAFYLDQAAYAAAPAAGEGDPRAEIRERYERRLAEAELLVDAAVPPAEAARPVLESLRRRIAEQRTRLK